jgi:hypothetical protein
MRGEIMSIYMTSTEVAKAQARYDELEAKGANITGAEHTERVALFYLLHVAELDEWMMQAHDFEEIIRKYVRKD